MILDEAVLQKIDDWHPPGTGRQTLAFLDADSETAVQLAIDRKEALGCELWEVGVSRPDAAMANDTLDAWAHRVADSVTGLLEPLRVVEIDQLRGQALLRSDEPATKSDDTFYYEVLLHKIGTASVRRYRGSRQPVKREQVSFVLTREAIGKLVADLASGAC